MSKRKLKKPFRNLLIWSRRLVILVILLGIGLTIWGLIEPQDDGGTPILSSYQLVKENSRSAYIERIGDKEPVIPSIVISYSTCDGYIAARQTEVPATDDIKPDFTTFTYWLIDTKTGSSQAQLSTDDFNNFCTEHSLTFDEWLGT